MTELAHHLTYRINISNPSSYERNYDLDGFYLTDAVVWAVANELVDAANSLPDPPYAWGTTVAEVTRFDATEGTPVSEPS